ncbi:MAG: SRPBCC family protein [Nitriliruptoraceae bacterium]
MARIREPLQVPITPEQAFDHVADFTTSASWDPGITAARRLDEGPIGLGSRFEVKLALGPLSLPLVYEITHYERPERVVLHTKGAIHEGEDDVRFTGTEDGTEVLWNAMFRVRGPGVLLEPALARGFRRVGAKAVAGLERSLTELASS